MGERYDHEVAVACKGLYLDVPLTGVHVREVPQSMTLSRGDDRRGGGHHREGEEGKDPPWGRRDWRGVLCAEVRSLSSLQGGHWVREFQKGSMDLGSL